MELEYQLWAKQQERDREVRELRAIRRAQRIIGAEHRRSMSAPDDDGAVGGTVGQPRLIPGRLA